MRRYSTTHTGISSSTISIKGQMNDIDMSILDFGLPIADLPLNPKSGALWANLKSVSSLFPQGGEAHDRANQIFLGRERQRGNARALERLLQTGLALLGG